MSQGINLRNIKVAVIVGAGHGIGLGLVQELRAINSKCRIYATYRDSSRAGELLDYSSTLEEVTTFNVDPISEKQIESFFESLKGQKIDLLINAVGTLVFENKGPEKSLRDINIETLTNVFKVNSFVTPLIAKQSKKYFSKESSSVFCTLSAMVGSIGDNKIGGWYSYRASKAALNMFIKTISIEFKRYNLRCSVLAVHPGTTKTELSKDFLKNVKHKVWTANESAQNILDTIEKSSKEGTGLFKNWDNTTITW